jgi:hypothetical protein
MPVTWYPDLSNEAFVAFGDHVRAVGWLSADHPYRRGAVPAEFVARLQAFVGLANRSADALYFPAFGGFHTCELCEDVHDSRNFGVPAGAVLYVAPGMVAHYVEHHGYCPPDEFIAAILASPLPGTEAYRSAVDGFRQIHERWWQEIARRFRWGQVPADGPRD